MRDRDELRRIGWLFGGSLIAATVLFGAGGLVAGLAVDVVGAEHAHQMIPIVVATTLIMISVGLLVGLAVPWLYLYIPGGSRAALRLIAILAGVATVITYGVAELS